MKNIILTCAAFVGSIALAQTTFASPYFKLGGGYSNYEISHEASAFYDSIDNSTNPATTTQIVLDGNKNKSHSGNVFSGAFGYDLGPDVSAELEVNFGRTKKKVKPDSIDKKNRHTSVMMNFFYDFAPGAKFSPRIGAGIGYKTVNGKIVSIEPGATDMPNDSVQLLKQKGFNAGLYAGVAAKLTDNAGLELMYKGEKGFFKKKDKVTPIVVNNTSETVTTKYKIQHNVVLSLVLKM